MFGRKKDSAKISEKTPVFHARYIGCTETFVASGKGCTLSPVQRLWDNAPEERHMRRVHLAITPTGLQMKDAEKKSDPGREFPIENISFCNADNTINEHIFCWVTKGSGKGGKATGLECHAVLCSSREKARAMALVLSRAFQIAYKDWKTIKDKEDRLKKTGNLMSTLEKNESFSHSSSTSPSSPRLNQASRNGTSSPSNGNVGAALGSPRLDREGVPFAADAILDPEDEACMQRDSSVQAAAIGDTSSEASE